MADDEEAGATGGTGWVAVLEPRGPTEGLPPPERLWARTVTLNARMRRAQRKSGDNITGPQRLLNGKYMPVGRWSRHLCGNISKILQMRSQTRNNDRTARSQDSWDEYGINKEY